MKGLLKYLSPFAPDQSGAAAVFYALGGITVICDAGGCTGNICGFDEPRWFMDKSAVFSAGLRDMDAILGRDDRLVDKLKDAADRLESNFAVMIGTPVPAVIATDFRALKRMAKKRCGIPVMTVECTGTRLYDRGAEEAYLELFRTFAEKDVEKNQNAVGVIGMIPLDTSHVNADGIIRRKMKEKGYTDVYCYGMGSGLEEVKKAGSVAKNLVISPAGIKAAEYLKTEFGTPYEIDFPLLSDELKERLHQLTGKRILILHQQVAANEIRSEIRSAGSCYGLKEEKKSGNKKELIEEKESENVEIRLCEKSASDETTIICGTWFMQRQELKEPQDVCFEREEKFISYVEQEKFDVIIGDKMFRRALKDFPGEYIEVPHFAVSGEYEEEIC